METKLKRVQYVTFKEVILQYFPAGHQAEYVPSKFNGSSVWKFNQEANGESFESHGMRHDADGRVYVANYRGGVIAIDSRTDNLLQELLQDVPWCADVCWNSERPQLSLRHGIAAFISTFRISKA